MKIREVVTETLYWQRHWLKPVKGFRKSHCPPQWYTTSSLGFPGCWILRPVIVEAKEKGKVHITVLSWRKDHRLGWVREGEPAVTTARTLERMT